MKTQRMMMLRLLVIALLWAWPQLVPAQHRWALAVLDKNEGNLSVIEYHGLAERAANGMEYYRIFDDSYIFHREASGPVKLRYGYRLSGKRIYLYDFESQNETVAFDFSLSPGDVFTTFNGMEWRVESTKDTLVNMSFCGTGECVSKRLLSVRTLDGSMSDQWLEDFGSFANHFMVNSMENVRCSQTLWVEYGMGEYIARQISADPIYAHDSGWMDRIYGDDPGAEFTTCRFDNGQVVFESAQWWYEHRDYTCFYRTDNVISEIYSCEMNPQVDGGTLALRKDMIVFDGLPAPSSGSYTVHVDGESFNTGIVHVSTPILSETRCHDILGRALPQGMAKGVYIRGGRKFLAK